MILQILTRTPILVWILLALLIGLGWNQTRTRTLSLKRMIIVPLVMLGLALSGLSNAFGVHLPVLFTWLLSLVCTALFIRRLRQPSGQAYDAQRQLFTVPGSWLPLVLILGIFVSKYALAVTLAIQPGLAHELGFSLACAGLFGMMNGVFVGRTLRLMRLYHASRDYPGELPINA